jgi:hypothetical protein
LAQENDAQHKRLKQALEERRLAKKKLKDELGNKRLQKLTEAAGEGFNSLLNADEDLIAESAAILTDKLEQEFSA